MGSVLNSKQTNWAENASDDITSRWRRTNSITKATKFRQGADLLRPPPAYPPRGPAEFVVWPAPRESSGLAPSTSRGLRTPSPGFCIT